MTALFLIRMLMDLCVYAALAAPLGAAFGAAPAGCLLAVAACAAAYAAAGRLSAPAFSSGGRRAVRYLPLLLPLAVIAVLVMQAAANEGSRHALALLAVTVPAFLYTAWMVRDGNYPLSYDQCERVFQRFWKLYLGYFVLLLLLGQAELLSTASLPFGLVALVSSILMLRSLRHDLTVSTQPAYQAFNFGAAVLTMAAAWPFSTGAFRRGVVAALALFYNKLILPILMMLLDLMVLGLTAVDKVFHLEELFRRNAEGEPPQLNIEEWQQEMQEVVVGGEARWLVYFRAILGIAAAAALIILLFRFLSRRAAADGRGTGSGTLIRERIGAGERRAAPKPKGTVAKVRAQYRKFLKLCAGQGLIRKPADTTEELGRRAAAVLEEPGTVEQIRRIYIRARYDGEATDKDAEALRQLNASLKEKMKNAGS